MRNGKPKTVAAVDLGSNSFHMVLGTVAHGELTFVDRLRDPVRLAAGLDEDGSLDEDAVERALACLERFGQRLREVPRLVARAVGTHTLRRARAAPWFLSRARRALGVPIEILAGAEEARLIYLGVAHQLSDDTGVRLVVDIGGGSTECVLGERFEAMATESLHMGCVTFSRRFFGDGRLTPERFDRAEVAARVELETIEERYRAAEWTECVGASGTIKAVAEILRLQGWAEGTIETKPLRKLRKAMIEAGRTSRLKLEGLQPDRAEVLAGGVAILRALFAGLGIDSMGISRAALREGILYDLLGRIRHEDVRDRTISALMQRYHVDIAQADRVEQLALALFEQVAETWDLERGRPWLVWAARLHEIGRTVSYGGYQKHGAYIIANSDLPGFSQTDQELLAVLVRWHRRKLGGTSFDELPPFHRELAFRLCALLRIAVRLHRGRSARSLPPIRLFATEEGLELVFPYGWLDERPLTRADVDEEVAVLRRAGVRLVVR